MKTKTIQVQVRDDKYKHHIAMLGDCIKDKIDNLWYITDEMDVVNRLNRALMSLHGVRQPKDFITKYKK